MSEKTDVPYVNLAIAVINQAKLDIVKNRGHWKRDAEVFLESDWYHNLQALIDLYKNPEGNTL